ncbi:MAG: hypothetical protein ACRBCI_08825 [Cellvibrionaceae bacterium]
MNNTIPSTAALVDPVDDENTLTKQTKLSAILRWLGSGAILLSGIIFMFQGVQDLEMIIRYWSYIAFIAVLASVGFGSQLLFSDAKGARLSFGLAALLIPVQFSQLGGMVYSWLDGTVTLHQLVDFSSVSLPMLLLVAGVTVLLAGIVCYMAFTILMRGEKSRLLLLFLGANVLLLLPARDSLLGFMTVGAMGALYLLLENKYFKCRHIFSTKEGVAIRALLLFPFIIALVRLLLHIDTLASSAFLLLMVLTFIGKMTDLYCSHKTLRELLLILCTAFGSLGWAFFIEGTFVQYYGTRQYGIYIDHFAITIAILLPFSVCLSRIGRASSYPHIYRLLSAAIVGLLSMTLLSSYSHIIELFVIVLIGSLYFIAGYIRKEKANTIIGLLISIASILTLIFASIETVNINIWIILGVVGITLVMASSAVEKYGRKIVSKSHYVWTSLLSW